MIKPTLLSILTGFALSTLSNHVVAATDCTTGFKPILLKQGSNLISIQSIRLNIVTGRIETGTAFSRNTYVVYIPPRKDGEEWVHVPFSMEPNSPPSLGLEDAESADSTVRKVSFYRSKDSLCVAVASKIGTTPPELYVIPTQVKIDIGHFNASLEAPWIDPIKTIRTKQKYLEATDALNNELFKPE